MDIEGAEYRNILSVPESILSRFRIIVIELHGLFAFGHESQWQQEISPAILRLGNSHICVHVHANNCCGQFLEAESGLNIPSVLEATFLRKDRFTEPRTDYHPPLLPHPLDIARNLPDKPPIFLNRYLLPSHKRPLDSQLKLLKDIMDFVDRSS